MAETGRMSDAAAGYKAATTGVAFLDSSSRGRLHLSGAEHVDFLQRLSTNDVLSLNVGSGLRTVFCDHRGRIVEVAELCRIRADSTIAFLASGRPQSLIEWFDRFHFGESMDWRDETTMAGQLDVLGPEATRVCREILGLDLDQPTFSRLPHDSLDAMRLDIGGNAGARLWGHGLKAAGAELTAAGAPTISDESYEMLRVELGIAGGAEFGLEHNPWEAGLDDAIHLNKGCYTGQEVIARLDTYDKVKQHLVGLRLDAPVSVGASVEVQGRTIGAVTSIARSPVLGELALAYLRSDHCAPGTAVTLTDPAEGNPVGAVVSDLPFHG
ncbi:MAG TPA: glycine cleavage T C-terminal barrel domain-containing protein [Candidatus Latescibacteria bacterium]|nr:hypothetical protein [Gemmatimonadaceae bacterium]MDP6017786.1 glycine cleavage T C-terminal barrel domain-containing protein [Candidatus Latescibacterota bacterium]HJP32986.1 glycine cleavage T C-terminal barrel domain-containing protein [Candidatus Latescibacterota bacterium]